MSEEERPDVRAFDLASLETTKPIAIGLLEEVNIDWERGVKAGRPKPY